MTLIISAYLVKERETKYLKIEAYDPNRYPLSYQSDVNQLPEDTYQALKKWLEMREVK